jgi:hypothetical protein
MEIIKRLKEPTPSFWKKVQRIGLTLGVIGGAIMTAPVSLPAAIVSIGGYLATVGAVSAGLSQLTSTKR